ncbi:MAG: TolC family outer membrane protein [Gammaproteobacteria bacterium]|nr:TolC family outer membrane protein [Gammaproteobacteria bacterium]
MQTRTKKILLLLLGLGCAGSLHAENLLDIYKLARQNDPTYLAAVAEYEAAKQASPRAWASVLPQINLSGNHSEYDQDVTVLGNPTSGRYHSNSYTLKLTQTLFRKDQFDRISQADAQVAQAAAKFDSAKLDLILRAAQRYFNVLAAEDNLIFAQANKEAIEQQLQQTKQRFDVGLTAITDVHEAQARYDASVASEITARNQYAIRQEELREITHEPPGKLATLEENSPLLSPEPEDVEQWVKTALERNLLLLSAQKAMDAAQAGVSVARAGHYPTLDLQADYTNYDATGGFTTKTDGTTIALVLNLPLYAGGGVSAASRQAAAQYQQSMDLYEQQRRATERGTRNSYLTVIADISTVKALKQALRSSQTALEATKAGFDVGTRTAVEVLDSQQLVFQARSNYAKSRYDYILETLRLKQSAGTLAEDDIKGINSWLQ